MIGGTSASSPAFAGIVALLNDARLAKKLPPLGFLNPLLYSKDVAQTFNDITSGHNSGCGTTGFNVSIFSPVPYLILTSDTMNRQPKDGIQVRKQNVSGLGDVLISFVSYRTWYAKLPKAQETGHFSKVKCFMYGGLIHTIRYRA